MLLTLPKFRITNAAGTPYPSARLYIYSAGTTTPVEVYQNIDFNDPHANPVVADTEGLFPMIYIDTDATPLLRLIVKDQNDVAIPDMDMDDWTPLTNNFQDATFALSVSMESQLSVAGAATFTGLAKISNAAPNFVFEETDASTNEKAWDFNVESKVWSFRTRTDAFGAGKNVLVVTRGTSTALASIAIGNATDNPTITLNGLPFYATDSFTATLDDMSASTTGSITYIKIGRVATLYVTSGNIVGTSSGDSMILTGMPATLYPAIAGTRVMCGNVRDTGGPIICEAQINAGNIVFAPLKTNSVADYVFADPDGFTPSGSKGLLAGWTVTYMTSS